jgi:hypothetical protein
VTELLHGLSHAGGPLEFSLVAIFLAIVVLVFGRRARLRTALLLGTPGLLFMALALDLERLWPVPSLMRAVSLVEPGRYEFDVAGSSSLLWRRRVCLSLQITPGIPNAGPPVAAEVRYALADPLAGEIAERTIRSGEWFDTFSPVGGDGGMLCASPPKRFRAGLDVHEGDAQFEPVQTRLVVSVPRLNPPPHPGFDCRSGRICFVIFTESVLDVALLRLRPIRLASSHLRPSHQPRSSDAVED